MGCVTLYDPRCYRRDANSAHLHATEPSVQEKNGSDVINFLIFLLQKFYQLFSLLNSSGGSFRWRGPVSLHCTCERRGELGSRQRTSLVLETQAGAHLRGGAESLGVEVKVPGPLISQICTTNSSPYWPPASLQETHLGRISSAGPSPSGAKGEASWTTSLLSANFCPPPLSVTLTVATHQPNAASEATSDPAISRLSVTRAPYGS